jgi:glycosyltransferase involved in cell wall biosynthesis
MNFLNKNHFTAVHFNSANALFGAIGAKLSRFNPKTIFTVRGLSVLNPNYQKNKILKPIFYWFFKLLFYFINTIVFISCRDLEIAKKIKLNKKGIIIYNGIEPYELIFFSPGKAREILKQKTKLNLRDKFIIGSIGRLDYAKNYEFLINIFPKILKIKNNAVCLIIGAGTEEKKYQDLINKLNLENKIFLLGEIKNASQYIKAFDLFVLTSRYEGLPIVLLETLFAEMPILTTDVGGNAEIVNNSSEQLYELNNENDFLQKFKNFSANPQLCQKIAKQNKTLSQQFLIKKTVDEYLKVYKNENFI